MPISRLATQAPRTVTINLDQELYVIPEGAGSGFSCLGFDVLIARFNRLANALDWAPFPQSERGTLQGYERYRALREHAYDTGRRFTCELSPQLIGLEGHCVEVIDQFGDRRRFVVGKSAGWIPIHLELARRNSSGGMAAAREYRAVKDLERVK